MDVGKPRRRVTVEPIENPVPARTPEPAPAEKPPERKEPAKSSR
jgi:hypothetical protein